MKIYFDFNDWWIGYYRGKTHHYICLLPTIVIRWDRKQYSKISIAGMEIVSSKSCPPGTAYIIPKKLDDDYSTNSIDWPEKLIVTPETLKYIRALQSYKYPPISGS